MSVEKLCDQSKTIIENVPFAQISNVVTEHIKDNDAYRIWAYSFSKSRNWRVLKEFTQKVCGVGERKAEFVWSYLKRCGLINYERIIDPETNRFIRTDIIILNGTKFNINEPFLVDKSTPALSAGVGKSVDNSTPALSAAAEMTPLLNKDLRNKDNKSSCASQVKKSTAKSTGSNLPPSDWKQSQKSANEKKHSWANNRTTEKPYSGFASVTSQTTSYDPNRPARGSLGTLLKEVMDKMELKAHG